MTIPSAPASRSCGRAVSGAAMTTMPAWGSAERARRTAACASKPSTPASRITMSGGGASMSRDISVSPAKLSLMSRPSRSSVSAMRRMATSLRTSTAIPISDPAFDMGHNSAEVPYATVGTTDITIASLRSALGRGHDVHRGEAPARRHASAVVQRVDRGFLLSEALAPLAGAHADDLTQHENGPLALGQIAERVAQRVPLVVALGHVADGLDVVGDDDSARLADGV